MLFLWQEFERKDISLKARASTNLSCLYFLESDLDSAQRHACLSVETDRYCARAWVNKGNIAFAKGDLEAARSNYIEAIAMEADCFEAIYNLGCVNVRNHIVSKKL